MNLEIDSSTTLSERQQGHGYQTFLCQIKNLTNITEAELAQQWYYYIADNRDVLEQELDGETVLALSDFTRPRTTSSYNEFAKSVFNLIFRKFKSGQILTHQCSESSDTSPAEINKKSFADESVKLELRNLFGSFDYEDFDIDIAYYFTNALSDLIKENSNLVIRIITELIGQREINDNIICETLRAIGRLDDENTKSYRFGLLVKSLRDDTAIIRDAAVAGLSFIDDKRALPQLRMLFDKETIAILKSNIKVAIGSLET